MLTILMKHCSIDIPPPKLKALANFSTSSGELFWSAIVHLSVCPSLSLYTFLNFIFFSRTIGPILAKFCTKHPMRKGFQLFSNESQPIFQWEIIGIWKYTDDIWKSFSPKPQAQFLLNFAQNILWWRGIKSHQRESSAFFHSELKKIAKNKTLTEIFSRTNVPISSKYGTVFSCERDSGLFKWRAPFFQSEIMTKYNVVKIHQQNFIEIFISREPLGQGHPNWAQSNLELIQKGDDNFFLSFDQRNGIIITWHKWVYWLELFLMWVMLPMGLMFH